MRHLSLYAVNTSELYFTVAKDAMCQVAALLTRGNYTPARELVIWRRYVSAAYMRFLKECGKPDEPMHVKSYIDAVAAECANHYREELRDVYLADLPDLVVPEPTTAKVIPLYRKEA